MVQYVRIPQDLQLSTGLIERTADFLVFAHQHAASDGCLNRKNLFFRRISLKGGTSLQMLGGLNRRQTQWQNSFTHGVTLTPRVL